MKSLDKIISFTLKVFLLVTIIVVILYMLGTGTR